MVSVANHAYGLTSSPAAPAAPATIITASTTTTTNSNNGKHQLLDLSTNHHIHSQKRHHHHLPPQLSIVPSSITTQLSLLEYSPVTPRPSSCSPSYMASPVKKLHVLPEPLVPTRLLTVSTTPPPAPSIDSKSTNSEACSFIDNMDTPTQATAGSFATLKGDHPSTVASTMTASKDANYDLALHVWEAFEDFCSATAAVTSDEDEDENDDDTSSVTTSTFCTSCSTITEEDEPADWPSPSLTGSSFGSSSHRGSFDTSASTTINFSCVASPTSSPLLAPRVASANQYRKMSVDIPLHASSYENPTGCMTVPQTTTGLRRKSAAHIVVSPESPPQGVPLQIPQTPVAPDMPGTPFHNAPAVLSPAILPLLVSWRPLGSSPSSPSPVSPRRFSPPASSTPLSFSATATITAATSSSPPQIGLSRSPLSPASVSGVVPQHPLSHSYVNDDDDDGFVPKSSISSPSSTTRITSPLASVHSLDRIRSKSLRTLNTFSSSSSHNNSNNNINTNSQATQAAVAVATTSPVQRGRFTVTSILQTTPSDRRCSG